ncbi:MAG: NAD(P)H-dependent oxidoreductase [Gemmatimonadetes bacterium]|nr:NAD(P)H-dependent oxidoreductase [Gemmatimonadota bacterium]
MLPLLQIVIVSTREGRAGPAVARWFTGVAGSHGKFRIEVVDLAEVNLPLFDEPHHPVLRKYTKDHTKAWSAIVDRADAFVFVTPEYNYGAPPSVVNAIDFLSHEWAYKAAGFVSYGGVSGGVRAVQSIKSIITSVKVMPMFEAVSLPFFAQQLDRATGVFSPPAMQAEAGVKMLDELRKWSDALAVLRVRG